MGVRLTRVEARFPGLCAACGELFDEGDLIAAAEQPSLFGVGTSSKAGEAGWLHADDEHDAGCAKEWYGEEPEWAT